jgi:hypothetical protein
MGPLPRQCYSRLGDSRRRIIEERHRGGESWWRVLEDIVEGVTSDMVLVAEYFRTYYIALFK